MIGKRYSRLVIVSVDGKIWTYKCDCGTVKSGRSYDIIAGKIESCGCKKRDAIIKRNHENTTRDGLTHTPTGSSWNMMMSRCLNQNYDDYAEYGARGIIACDLIQQSPQSLIMLIGERPAGMSLDRRDNTGSYTCGQCVECQKNSWPLNVRWATPTQQGRNQRTNRLITICGVTQCLAEWAEQAEIGQSALRRRLERGWEGLRLLTPT